MIDLHSDDYFMGEALRQAARAEAEEETPVGAVIVRQGRIVARAFNQVELLKDSCERIIAAGQVSQFIFSPRSSATPTAQ